MKSHFGVSKATQPELPTPTPSNESDDVETDEYEKQAAHDSEPSGTFHSAEAEAEAEAEVASTGTESKSKEPVSGSALASCVFVSRVATAQPVHNQSQQSNALSVGDGAGERTATGSVVESSLRAHTKMDPTKESSVHSMKLQQQEQSFKSKAPQAMRHQKEYDTPARMEAVHDTYHTDLITTDRMSVAREPESVRNPMAVMRLIHHVLNSITEATGRTSASKTTKKLQATKDLHFLNQNTDDNIVHKTVSDSQLSEFIARKKHHRHLLRLTIVNLVSALVAVAAALIVFYSMFKTQTAKMYGPLCSISTDRCFYLHAPPKPNSWEPWSFSRHSQYNPAHFCANKPYSSSLIGWTTGEEKANLTDWIETVHDEVTEHHVDILCGLFAPPFIQTLVWLKNDSSWEPLGHPITRIGEENSNARGDCHELNMVHGDTPELVAKVLDCDQIPYEHLMVGCYGTLEQAKQNPNANVKYF